MGSGAAFLCQILASVLFHTLPHLGPITSGCAVDLELELPSLEHSVLSSERPTDLKGDHEFKERIEADGLPLCQIPEGVVTCLTFE